MKRTAKGFLPLLFLGMLTYTGCARQELVKKGESLVPPAAKPATAAQAKPAALPDKPAAANIATGSPVTEEVRKAPAQEISQGDIAELQRGLEKVYFDFDSAKLSQEARRTLVKDTALFKQNPKARIRIEGHCDERGSDEYNLALGEKRARAALEYLVTMGISADRLSVISYGREKPADPGHDEAAWAKNRRDEFVPVNP